MTRAYSNRVYERAFHPRQIWLAEQTLLLVAVSNVYFAMLLLSLPDAMHPLAICDLP